MTKVAEALSKRRTYYHINKDIPVTTEEIKETVMELAELVPDAFNMKSARAVIVTGEKQDKLWDLVYDSFEGKVPREKIDGFKAGAGTILYFYDEETIRKMQETYPAYAENFPVWANQANGMLQISVWTALCELGMGASLQHYNPMIDEKVKKWLDIPESYKLIAQMPFGGIAAEPLKKEKGDPSLRVSVKE